MPRFSDRRIRALLARWYVQAKRDLPWRRTRDPYRIWVSEIMLQQTRVAAVLPYYERFLAAFPNVKTLAAAEETAVLAAWSGLGYYRRARNLHRAARLMVANGAFPEDYERIRALPGVGDYTAAAIASIAFRLPYACVDGNVRRVLARLFGPEAGTPQRAQGLLDAADPGAFNQALMELGATVCLPRAPRCGECPLAAACHARRAGKPELTPPGREKPRLTRISRTLLVIRRGERVLMYRTSAESPRMPGFWELPDAAAIPEATHTAEIGSFRHIITRYSFAVRVVAAKLSKAPPGFRWMPQTGLARLPISTLARKALFPKTGDRRK